MPVEVSDEVMSPVNMFWFPLDWLLCHSRDSRAAVKMKRNWRRHWMEYIKKEIFDPYEVFACLSSQDVFRLRCRQCNHLLLLTSPWYHPPIKPKKASQYRTSCFRALGKVCIGPCVETLRRWVLNGIVNGSFEVSEYVLRSSPMESRPSRVESWQLRYSMCDVRSGGTRYPL